MTRVAVIIAARDVAPFLGDAIGSALTQSAVSRSVVIVDDGSTDDTPNITAAFPDPDLHTMRTSGLGVSAARNLGARHPAALAADALLFLDGDDWLSTNALARLSRALAANPRAVAAYGAFAFVMDRAAASPDVRKPPSRLPLSRLILGNRFNNGGHVLIRRTAWQAAGGFDEALRFAEDWEFWPRLRLQGPFVAVPGPPVLRVRRRPGSLMHGQATQPVAYEPALATMGGNPRLAQAVGPERLDGLIRRARRELHWTIGREMLRRGAPRPALPLLVRGFFGQARPQRCLILLRAAWAACRLSQPGKRDR